MFSEVECVKVKTKSALPGTRTLPERPAYPPCIARNDFFPVAGTLWPLVYYCSSDHSHTIRCGSKLKLLHPAEDDDGKILTQRRMRTSVWSSLQRLLSAPTPENVPGGQHFPSNDDVQTDDYHRLAPLSGGGFLRHQCTEIGLMIRLLC
ncbi:hypothetical protein AVEN_254135-1 [Araneus ventricosus]|uniref:Uncharacterized protein n=1 Tax=Araneus ventricosus TaxID=182803 RepID=A0A4Y2BZ64_ARAVE|nr:hypothetical protein AVEN_254135-1 [Araneus ventricosus]